MKIHAVIMAGGRGSRLFSDCEKPLTPILGKPMVDYIIDALSATTVVGKIAAAISPHTPKSGEHFRSRRIPVVTTRGESFVNDLRAVFHELKIRDGLVVACDLPGVRAEIFEKAVETYFHEKKSALCVAVPINSFKGTPNDEIVLDNGLYAVGINVIDGMKLEADRSLDQHLLVVDAMDFVNVNAPADIITAERLLAATTPV